MDCSEPDYSDFACYALGCNPELSIRLAAQHFAIIREREQFESIAMATAAAAGKMPRLSRPVENHWLETAYGREYWELKQTYATTAYGSRFVPIVPNRQLTDRNRSAC